MAKQIVHTEQCRKRMEESMRKTAKGRKWLEKSDTKIAEYLEKAHDDKERADKKGGAEEPSTPESQIDAPSSSDEPAMVENPPAETLLEQNSEDKDEEGTAEREKRSSQNEDEKEGKKEKRVKLSGAETPCPGPANCQDTARQTMDGWNWMTKWKRWKNTRRGS